MSWLWLYLGIEREWLYRYDEQGVIYSTPEERAQILEKRLRSRSVAC